MATENPDPNRQAEAFKTPQQVINHTTGETAPDFEIQPSSLDRKINPSAPQPFPALLYKLSSAGKTLSVKVTNQQEYDRALSQGWHIGHPVKAVEIVEAEAEGLQPLSILGGDDDEPTQPKRTTAAERATIGAGIADNDAVDAARATRDAKNAAVERGIGVPDTGAVSAISGLSAADAKEAIAVAETHDALNAHETAEYAGKSRSSVLQAIADRRAELG